MKRFRHMQMFIYDDGKVFSYYTHVGNIHKDTKTFHEWGYGKHSTTTSRQITTLCRDYGLTRIHYNNYEEYLERNRRNK